MFGGTMFGFMDMYGNYEQRKVDNFTDKEKGIFVDTCMVTDSSQPYETAIEHPKYNRGKMIIVEMYDTKEEAQTGHDKWVKTMTGKNLPKTLKDVSSCEIAKILEEADKSDWRINKKAK